MFIVYRLGDNPVVLIVPTIPINSLLLASCLPVLFRDEFVGRLLGKHLHFGGFLREKVFNELDVERVLWFELGCFHDRLIVFVFFLFAILPFFKCARLVQIGSFDKTPPISSRNACME